MRFSPRRLVIVDMWGSGRGGIRRYLVMTEFCFAVPLAGLLGIRLIWWGSSLTVVLGVWSVGVAVNYLPLSIHGLRLARPRALNQAVSDLAETPIAEGYAVKQFWILIPGAVAAADIAERARRTPRT